MNIKELALPFYQRFKYLKYFRKFYRPIGLSNLVWCFANGFFPKNYILFGFKKNDPSNYITDYEENFRISRINKEAKLINNKIIFTEIVKSVVPMPAVKGIIDAGKFVEYATSGCTSMNNLLQYIRNSTGVIFKPIDGDGGVGIFLVKYLDNQYWWNQSVVSEEQLRDLIGDLHYYYISDLVEQNAYSSQFYTHSVNTIRILTFMDPVLGKPFIAVAAHRIGNEVSRPVDNCAKGGLTAAINIETGELSKAVRTYFDGAEPIWYAKHPDTGAQIEGFVIPGWEAIKIKTLELAEKFSFLPSIGWDMVVLPDGSVTVLEANSGADLKLHQVHKPLLLDNRIREFYQYYGIRKF